MVYGWVVPPSLTNRKKALLGGMPNRAIRRCEGRKGGETSTSLGMYDSNYCATLGIVSMLSQKNNFMPKHQWITDAFSRASMRCFNSVPPEKPPGDPSARTTR
jgi:hypothetical protein